MKWERISTKHNRPILPICPRKAERYGLILQVGLPVQLVGVVVVLPTEIHGLGTLMLSSYGSTHEGPTGPVLSEVHFHSPCTDGNLENDSPDKDNGGQELRRTNVVFPNPVPLVPLLHFQLELKFWPKTSNGIITKQESSDVITSTEHNDVIMNTGCEIQNLVKSSSEEIFGRSSLPERTSVEREALQKPLRWFEMRKEGYKPVGSQIPIIYYIT